MDFDFSSPIILQNKRALLQPLTANDDTNLLAVGTASDDLVLYSPYQIHTPELLQSFIHSSLADRTAGFRYPFTIFDKQQNAFAGCTSIANVSNRDKRLEIGWTWIGKPFQQTGLNRACKHLLLSYAFDTLGFERVEFKTDARNSDSRAAIEKIGGRYEGALRNHTLMLDGFRRTTVYYSILKEEWPALKTTVFGAWAMESQ